jgi:hypothetical protein
MEFESQITRVDVFFFQALGMLRSRMPKIIAVLMGMWTTYSATQKMLETPDKKNTTGILIFTAIAATVVFGILSYLLFTAAFCLIAFAKAMSLKADAAILLKNHITLNENGIISRDAGSSMTVNWAHIERVEKGTRLLLLWHKGSTQSHILPIRDLPPGAIDFVRSHVSAAQKTPVSVDS